jgi:hypothetical protein
MPVHDWTRVSAGTFHDFHCAWIAEIRKALNDGRLPKDYYAQAEQVAGEVGSGVRTWRALAIRHSRRDQLVASLEIVSPDNKGSQLSLRTFVMKSADLLAGGCHLLMVDLFPPGQYDPEGIHGALWANLSGNPEAPPTGKPLTLASYEVDETQTAYVELIAVGEALPDMPLVLAPGRYVTIPLEVTYRAAWEGTPQRWKRVLEAPAT